MSQPLCVALWTSLLTWHFVSQYLGVRGFGGQASVASVACEAKKAAAPLKPRVFHGTIVHSRGLENFQFMEDAVLGVDAKGKIVFVGDARHVERLCKEHGLTGCETVNLSRWQFLIPGMVDTHIHGAQIENSGTGYDEQLLEWLKKYTFPTEAKFVDPKHAKKAYAMAVVSGNCVHGQRGGGG